MLRSELLTMNKKLGPGLMRARKCAVTTVNMVAKISFVLFP
ncbi:hypothetical protein HMPREF1139_0197 [Campylobacter sp. FOBRC14]|nr:hypothetical protein HMPREF1139_0197 [Campylobacter sp. FOBRC14]